MVFKIMEEHCFECQLGRMTEVVWQERWTADAAMLAMHHFMQSLNTCRSHSTLHTHGAGDFID